MAMAAVNVDILDCFPEMILIEILSYLNVQELIRTARVCRRWRLLVKDQRLWRNVDLSTWKRVTSRVLWTLLRQYFGRGLCSLHLQGLLQSARGGSFLTEPWLHALGSKCPRLRRLSLTLTDLRGLHSCSLLPSSLKVLELHSCELPPGFFTHSPPAPARPDSNSTENKHPTPSTSSGPSVETLILDNVPSFTDQHLQSLSSWGHLHHLELRNLLRVTIAGVMGCAPPGPNSLLHLTHLELESSSRQQMMALGLANGGWAGLERLALGGREVTPGLLRLNQLPGLRWLQLRGCRVAETMLMRVFCHPALKGLRTLEFLQVEFVIEDERDKNEAENRSQSCRVPEIRRALANLLPDCSMLFTQCTVTVNPD
ncbi:F-box/LRR-repeat protein 12-like [Trichomycterus rosablanca]|uniref:F-box/LRR-repeat protein 12-like n=1 Tax=Trichomycterus rosablanca TaxID=2290929 RepID=UPI002F357665